MTPELLDLAENKRREIRRLCRDIGASGQVFDCRCFNFDSIPLSLRAKFITDAKAAMKETLAKLEADFAAL